MGDNLILYGIITLPILSSKGSIPSRCLYRISTEKKILTPLSKMYGQV
ncbi:hypothetical protein HMPREF1989_01701 [Porphyromonas gingivalis F0566]|nr:hypothetical protein HMPREF1989_01701 [Porphyromonas gingivalis F0566]